MSKRKPTYRGCVDCGESMLWEHQADVRCAACRQAIGAAITETARRVAVESVDQVVEICSLEIARRG